MPVTRRVPLRDYPAHRIALVKPSALGDVIQSLPVLHALRCRYPDAHITWVVNAAYEPLLRGHPDLDATLPFDRAAVRSGWRQALQTWASFLRRLRALDCDLVIDLQGLLRSGLLTACTMAPRRVGLGSCREGASWFYTDVVSVADGDVLHAVDRYWLMAEAFGVGDVPKVFHVPIAEAEQRWAADLLRGQPRPWLAFAVGSRWETKRWPPAHFAALACRAQANFGGTVVFVGGGEDSLLARQTAVYLTGPRLDLTGKTSLPRLAAVLAAADVLVANDTGPLHLAAALGRPVIAPYTCTRVRLNGPYGGAAGTVEARIWCQGSYLKRCPRLECMAVLTPDLLWPSLHEVLQRWESNLLTA